MKAERSKGGDIRVGIGGWSYDPWRTTFYPAEVSRKEELAYASRQLTAIEINSTFYRLQAPHIYAKWRDATPDDFVFAVKAPRFVTHRKVLADAESAVVRFVESGIAMLQAKLGPLLWQLDPSHPFEAKDLSRFLELLPDSVDGRPLRHALNVRHESFRDEKFIVLARKHRVAVVLEDDAVHPEIADVTSDFVYARLRKSLASVATGYSRPALKRWAARAESWSQGEEPDDLQRVTSVKARAEPKPRDVFVFFINGAKERAPAAAMQLIADCRSAQAVGNR